MQKTKLISVSLVLFSFLLLLPSFSFGQYEGRGRLGERIERQHHKINDALRDGRITDRQADDLRYNLRQVRDWYERDRDAGSLNHEKAEWYNSMLDKNDRMLERSEGRSEGRTILRFW